MTHSTRKTPWKIGLLLPSLLLVLLLNGCGTTATESTPPPENPDPPQSQNDAQNDPQGESQNDAQHDSPETNFPLTLVDQAGREVTLETKPERLVTGYYISTSILLSLDLADSVVGVEQKAESRPIYTLSGSDFVSLPNVGSAKEFNLETCAMLEPDLVILPLSLADTADILGEMGITALCINPEDQALLQETIGLLSQATDSQERGEALLAYLQDKTQALIEILAESSPLSLYLASNSSLLATAGSAMYQHSLIELSGNHNVATDLQGNYWAEISLEQLLAYDPDLVILPSGAGYSVEEILADETLSHSRAVSQAQVFAMPGDMEAWDSPIPSSFLGAYWLASLAHPTLVSQEDFQQEVTEFYQTFYGFTPQFS